MTCAGRAGGGNDGGSCRGQPRLCVGRVCTSESAAAGHSQSDERFRRNTVRWKATVALECRTNLCVHAERSISSRYVSHESRLVGTRDRAAAPLPCRRTKNCGLEGISQQ